MRASLAWLQEFADCQKRSTQEIAVLLTMAGLEVEEIEEHAGDTVFELGITPNRPDCLSIYGVAREIAVVSNTKLHSLKHKVPEGSGAIASHLRITIDDASGCPRYAARRIEGVKVGPSPAYVQQRLEAAGVRPINNIVDATNYVMLETGQPLHAFDERFIHGQTITICRAGRKFDFTTLDGITRHIENEDVLICDGQGPIAVAGVMGGQNSEVREDTDTVILESAYFCPTAVRKTSKRLGLSTESSRRFERGVDPNRVAMALQRVTECICEWAGGTPSEDWYDLYDTPITGVQIDLPLGDIERLLGIHIDFEEAKGILKRLGFEIDEQNAEQWGVTVPTDRPDVTRPADLIEEIARVYGYDRIPAVLPEAMLQSPSLPAGDQLTTVLRTRLQALGFSEAIHLAFESASDGAVFTAPGAQPIKMQNPLGSEETWLKTSLAGGLVKAAALNARNGRSDIRLFELRPSFRQIDGQCTESLCLSLVMGGARRPSAWSQPQDMIDFFDARGIVEQIMQWVGGGAAEWSTAELPAYVHPGMGATVRSTAGRIGSVGLLHPKAARYCDIESDLYVIELEVERLLGSRLQAEAQCQYRGIVRYPGVRRDMALLVADTVSAQDIEQCVASLQEPLIVGIELFDVYTGERIAKGQKSMAYAVQYQDPERTLTDDVVSAIHERVVAILRDKLGAEIRTS